MSVLKWLIILISQFHYLLDAQPVTPLYEHVCGGNETEYSPNGAYDTNLKTLLFSVSSNMDIYGFYNASKGQNPDKVNVMALCRGDVELQTCRGCVHNATRDMLELCPKKKQALGFYDHCQLRYSDESIIGNMSTNPQKYLYYSFNATDPKEFVRDLRAPLDGLRNEASKGGKRKFASTRASGPDFKTTLYAHAQCTPDLSALDCTECLTTGYTSLPDTKCYGKQGCIFLMPSCNFRFEPYRYINDGPPPEAPPPSPLSLPPPPSLSGSRATGNPPVGKDDKTVQTVIIIVVSAVALVILSACISVILMRKRQKRKRMDEIHKGIDTGDISTAESLQYAFSTITAATDNFSNENKLGQGGFGPVYKGKLSNGKEVAVKRLSANSGQGDLEFKNEVLLVARLQHRNLVRLLGFCLDGAERLLVYEFVPNASLDQFLFDPAKRTQLDWGRRFKIIVGIAKAILYLHEDSRLRIIHRDLKASNVLLDEEMNPKISDFGMARLFALDETQGSTSRIVGTYGYMAPEYAMHGRFSVKSDVYSFGVLVLEILSGQRNTCSGDKESVEDLLSFVWLNWREETASNVIDPMIRESSGPVRDMIRCIHIALLCVQENVADRPTMDAVVIMLSSSSLSLPLPLGSSYSMRSDFNPETSLVQEENSRSMSESTSSRNEVSITELYPR